jgi:hypothetical protein
MLVILLKRIMTISQWPGLVFNKDRYIHRDKDLPAVYGINATFYYKYDMRHRAGWPAVIQSGQADNSFYMFDRRIDI